MSEVACSPFRQYFRDIYDAVSSTAKGMWITFKYVWANPVVTQEYPEVREVLPEKSRSRLFNYVEDCIACTQCAMACPVDCIYIASTRKDKDAPAKTARDGTPIRLDLKQFTIDTALCCYCGLCTTVCPTQCLTHTTDYEYASYTCSDMKYDYLSDEVRAWSDRLIK